MIVAEHPMASLWGGGTRETRRGFRPSFDLILDFSSRR